MLKKNKKKNLVAHVKKKKKNHVRLLLTVLQTQPDAGRMEAASADLRETLTHTGWVGRGEVGWGG